MPAIRHSRRPMKRIQNHWWITLGLLIGLFGWMYVDFRMHAPPILAEGAQVPDFQGVSVGLGAPTLSLADLRGEVVLVDFWGTYCGSCLDVFPELDQLHREFGPRGLRVVAITDEKNISSETIARVAHEAGATFEVLRVNGKAFDDFLVHGVPMSFLIGRGGKLVARNLGISPREPHSHWLTRAGRSQIEDALREPPLLQQSSSASGRISWADVR